MRHLAGIISLALACGLAGYAVPTTAADIEIPVVNSLTGNGAFLGNQQKQTLQIIEKTINDAGGIRGNNVRFTFHDDQSKPQVAVQLLTEIAASKVVAVMGSSLAATCNAMAPLVKNGPVMYCFSAAMQPAPGTYAFSAGVSTHDQADALLKYFHLKGWNRIALISSTDASGQDGDRAFNELFARPDYKDLKLVAHVNFNLSDVSVSAQMEQIRAADPQALIAWTIGTPAATVFRGMIQAGIELPVGTSGGNMNFAQIEQFASFLPKELYMMNPEWPAGGDPRFHLDPKVQARQRELYATYEKAAIKLDAGAVVAWDPAGILVEGLRQLPPDATAGQLREWMAHLRYAGVHGLYDFEKTPQRGLDVDNVLVARWDAAANTWKVVSEPGGAPLAE
jgi:branched-chain amino acid transport system substrate-binding protein